MYHEPAHPARGPKPPPTHRPHQLSPGARIEAALHTGHGLSAREYALLDVLSRQHDGEGGHLQMKQVAGAVVLSQSATTRLVTRLEDRGLLSRYLCATDRRGIYTDVTGAGLRLLGQARPTYEAALCAALDLARRDPLLEPLVAAVPGAARHNRPKSL
ncbi:MarR family transcriptional regulator [Streptomyces sp. HD1123-B1]|uniref:MarR family winged helix-turn-helix transcriptional regulator n=1 Tax=Streptomyces huangiella TaxID=3228804 RepID=UPI003D7D5166